MLLDQETLRFIFGLKLRSLRQDKGLSLKSLARDTGLSPSYINEIEKGKKYPKSDKIIVLAESLGVSYEELISLKLKKELRFLSRLLENNLLKGMPFDVFGIPAQTLFELMAEQPQKIRALVGTLLELARNFDINVEDFFYASLRAYLDMNKNYFPDIEKKVEEFRRRFSLTLESQNNEELEGRLKKILTRDYRYRVVEADFEQRSKDLHGVLFVHTEGKSGPKLMLHSNLSTRERLFILAKELAYPYLGLTDRLHSSVVRNLDSFETLFNHFKASYFSSSLLIPKKSFIDDIDAFFGWEKWDPDAFLQWVQKYPGTLESFFHRFSQILPSYFKMERIFYLRFDYNPANESYTMVRELHLSQLHAPHGVKSEEHYCRRWISTMLPKKLASQGEEMLAGAQKSNFVGSNTEYICFSIAHPHDLEPGVKKCVTLGIQIDKRAREAIKFLDDPEISSREVGPTCEQCGIVDCEERAAKPRLFEQKEREDKRQKAIDTVIAAERD